MFSDSSEEEEAELVVLYDSSDGEEEQRPIEHQHHRNPRRRAPLYFFDVNVSAREFREKHRVSPALLEHLVDWIGPELARETNRGLPLAPRQRIQVFLHFLGTNGFYHDIGGSHVISRATVGNIVKEVCNVLFNHRNEVLRWPENPESLAQQFFNIARIPCVAGRKIQVVALNRKIFN